MQMCSFTYTHTHTHCTWENEIDPVYITDIHEPRPTVFHLIREHKLLIFSTYFGFNCFLCSFIWSPVQLVFLSYTLSCTSLPLTPPVDTSAFPVFKHPNLIFSVLIVLLWIYIDSCLFSGMCQLSFRKWVWWKAVVCNNRESFSTSTLISVWAISCCLKIWLQYVASLVVWKSSAETDAFQNDVIHSKVIRFKLDVRDIEFSLSSGSGLFLSPSLLLKVGPHSDHAGILVPESAWKCVTAV